jgi:hypothetical protein
MAFGFSQVLVACRSLPRKVPVEHGVPAHSRCVTESGGIPSSPGSRISDQDLNNSKAKSGYSLYLRIWMNGSPTSESG